MTLERRDVALGWLGKADSDLAYARLRIGPGIRIYQERFTIVSKLQKKHLKHCSAFVG